MNTLGSESAAEIERAIERTRSELGLTIDALERKLAVRHLVEEGIDMLKDSLGGYAGLRCGLAAVRKNPLPVALIGVGAAWFAASGAGVFGDAGPKGAAGDGRIGTVANDDTGRRSADPAGGEAAGDEAAGWIAQASDAAQGAVHGALRSVRESSDAVADRAGACAGYAGRRASRVADQVADAFHRHPLLIGTVGLLAGAVVAALLPATRVEDSWVGETRDELWQKAEDAGFDAAARVRTVAERSVGAAADAAYHVAKEETDRIAPKHDGDLPGEPDGPQNQ
jgi:hypothetical protein